MLHISSNISKNQEGPRLSYRVELLKLSKYCVSKYSGIRSCYPGLCSLICNMYLDVIVTPIAPSIYYIFPAS